MYLRNWMGGSLFYSFKQVFSSQDFPSESNSCLKLHWIIWSNFSNLCFDSMFNLSYLSGPGLPPVNVRKNGFFLDWKDNFLKSASFYLCTYILKILEKSCSRWSFGSPVHISSLNLSGLIWIIRIFFAFRFNRMFWSRLKGQLISKCLFGDFNSPKNKWKQFDLRYHCIVVKLNFEFWENWRYIPKLKTFRN